MKIYRPTFFKKLKDQDGEILNLPNNVKVRGTRHGFCLAKNGRVFTPKLEYVQKRDNYYLGELIGKTKTGPLVKIDASRNAKVSIPFEKVLFEGKRLFVLTVDKRFVVVDELFRNYDLEYCLEKEIVDDKENKMYIVSKDDGKNSVKYGIVSADGQVVCPPCFASSNLRVKRLDGRMFIVGSNSYNGKEVLTKDIGAGGEALGIDVNSVMLKGDSIIQLSAWQNVYSPNYKDDKTPLFAVYDKKENTCLYYSYEKENKKFEPISEIGGKIRGFIEQNAQNKIYFMTELAENQRCLMIPHCHKCIAADHAYAIGNSVKYRQKDQTWEIYCGEKIVEPIVIEKNGKLGLYDTVSDSLVLDAKYDDIVIATKNENDKYRFLVLNGKNHYGIVDEKGKTIVPFEMNKLHSVKKIAFGQGKRWVAKLSIETKTGAKYVYVDLESKNCLASDLSVGRFLKDDGKSAACATDKSNEQERE